MVDRRKFLGMAAGAGASLALTPPLLRALGLGGAGAGGLGSSMDLIQRAIPSSGEKLPVVGLSFSNHPACADHAVLKQILKAMVDNGGTVYDAMHGNGSAEEFHARIATELGVQDKMFWSTRGTAPGGAAGPPAPGPAAVKSHIDTWLGWTKQRSMDLVMLPVAAHPSHLEALLAEKKAGRVRYVGVQLIADNGYAQMESLMRSQPLDFIGVDFDIANRARVEDVILPLALERKIGVMAFFPFGNNGGVSCGSGSNLFGRVGNRPVPEWAAEFDAKTWAQFFLKYVVSHPAITVARVGTTKVHHMIDNLGGGVGRLPDDATRKRMAALIDALPPVTLSSGSASAVFMGPPGAVVLSTAVLDRYVGKYKLASGGTVTFRRYGALMTATAQPAAFPESVVYALSDTRFSLGTRDTRYIEFQLDDDEVVTGFTIEHGGQKVAATRVR